MKLIQKIIILSLASFPVLTYGTVTITGNIAELFQQDQMTPVNVGSVGVLVVDTNGSGFASSNDLVGTTLTNGSTYGIASNLILGSFSAEDLGGFVGFNFSPLQFSLDSNITVGDKLALFWFPELVIGSTVDAGASYGFFRTDEILSSSGATSSWVVQADGSTSDISAFQDSITSGNNGIMASTLSASLNAVPEPSTYAAIAGAMVLGFTAFRRRRA